MAAPNDFPRVHDGSPVSPDLWYNPVAEAVTAVRAQLAAGLWVAWTPTLTNLTQGDGAVLARYAVVGGTVVYRFRFTLGGTSAVGSGPRFSLPVAPADYAGSTPLGTVVLTDTGTTNRWGYVQIATGSSVDIIGFSTTGTSVGVTATSPHTWAATDVIAVTGSYEAA